MIACLRFVAASLLLLTCTASGSGVTELPKLLQSGTALSDLAAVAGDDVVYRIEIPVGATQLRIRTLGGIGNCDVYARRDAYPSPERYNARSLSQTTEERITIDLPSPGTWYVLVRAESAYRGVRLKTWIEIPRRIAAVPLLRPLPGAFVEEVRIRLKSTRANAVIRYTIDGSDPVATSPRYSRPLRITESTTLKVRAFLPNGSISPLAEGRYVIEPAETLTTLTSGIPAVHRGGRVRSRTFFKINVPPGQKSLRILTGGGSGQSDIFVAHGTTPTPKRFTRKHNGRRNSASLTIAEPEEGDWYILLRGRTEFSGAFVLATVQSNEPDLTVWPGRLQPYISELESFSEEDCEVVEDMIEPGERRLLRFTTESRNLGGADLVMGRPEDHPELFEYQDCHDHYHFKGFASYRLLDLEGAVAATGKKVSFCLEDVIPWDPGAGRDAQYDCHVQGIQAGWADVYDSGLPGQWVDITGVPPGNYQLEITVNPDQLLFESDYTNNTVTVPVTIPPIP